MVKKADVQRFILLPARGVQAGETSNPRTASFLRSLHAVTATTARRPAKKAVKTGLHIRVIDSVRANGAKLVELSPQETVALRAEQPGVRIVPVVYYYPALAPRHTVVSRAKTAARDAGDEKTKGRKKRPG
jgi:hypothetical protein